MSDNNQKHNTPSTKGSFSLKASDSGYISIKDMVSAKKQTILDAANKKEESK